MESTKEETEKKNNYSLVKAAQDCAISESESSKSEKETILGDKKSDLVEFQADLCDEEGLRAPRPRIFSPMMPAARRRRTSGIRGRRSGPGS